MLQQHIDNLLIESKFGAPILKVFVKNNKNYVAIAIDGHHGDFNLFLGEFLNSVSYKLNAQSIFYYNRYITRIMKEKIDPKNKYNDYKKILQHLDYLLMCAYENPIEID